MCHFLSGQQFTGGAAHGFGVAVLSRLLDPTYGVSYFAPLYYDLSYCLFYSQDIILPLNFTLVPVLPLTTTSTFMVDGLKELGRDHSTNLTAGSWSGPN